MTGTDIINAVRAEVIEPNPAFYQTNTLLLWINNGQKNYVRKTRCLQNYAITSTVSGQNKYAMPTDWLASEKIFWNNPVGGSDNWNALIPTSLEKMSQENPNFLSSSVFMQGNPQQCFIVGQTLYLYPTPQFSGSNDLFLFYESKPAVLNAITDPLSVDDSLADGVEAYVLWKMYAMDGEPQLAGEQMQRFIAEIGQGLKWKKQRVLDGKWKIDIQSFQPYSFSSVNGAGLQNQFNPLNI